MKKQFLLRDLFPLVRRSPVALCVLLWTLTALWPAASPAIGKPSGDNRPAASSRNVITTSSLVLEHRQIVIEGLVVEVDSTEARRWGIEMFYTRNDADGGGNLAGAVMHGPGNFPLAGVPSLNPGANPPEVNFNAQPVGLGGTFDGFRTNSGAFQSRVRAAVIKGKANILSQPIAVTRTGAEVTLATVDEIPFQDMVSESIHSTFYSKNDREMASVEGSYTNKKAGIILKVLPTLSPPDRVDLKITRLEVGQLAGFIHVRGVSRPIIENSVLETEVQLANNESILLSGIKTTREQHERRGIPYLKDLPVLGFLFGSNTVSIDRVDILFMVTPHLLNPGENPQAPRDFKNDAFFRAF